MVSTGKILVFLGKVTEFCEVWMKQNSWSFNSERKSIRESGECNREIFMVEALFMKGKGWVRLGVSENY